MLMLRLLVVEDHPMMREALLTALAEETNMAVVAQAANGAQGIKLYKEYRPDVVVMDLLMPGVGGLEAIAGILEEDPQAKILVLSSLEDEAHILAAVQAGALGYLPKTAERSTLVEAVYQVGDGLPYLPPEMAARLFKGLRQMKLAPADPQTRAALTARQSEILALMAEGHDDEEIGRRLHIGANTVRSHIQHILDRLGLESRGQAMAYARRGKG